MNKPAIQQQDRSPKTVTAGWHQRALAAALAVGLFGLLPAGAQESGTTNLARLKSLNLEQLLEVKVDTVYAASKREQSLADAPSSVSIVTAQDIQHYGHRTLSDILNSVRGLYVNYSRGYTFLGVRGLNLPGDYGGRNLILVDGHRMNEPLFDTASLGNDFILDVDMIERVEIIRGPGSVMYGNNALFSVVNVISKRGRDYNWGEASVEGGDFDTFKGRFTVGHQFDNGLEALFSGSWLESAGEKRIHFPVFDDGNPLHNGGVAENLDGERAHHFFTQWRYGDFTLEAAYNSRYKDVPHDGYDYIGTVFNTRYDTTDDQAFVDLKFERQFADDWFVLARVNYNQYVYDSYSTADWYFTGDPAQYALNYDWARARWLGVEAQISKHVGDRLLLTGGAEVRDYFQERYQNEDLAPAAVYSSVDQSSYTWGAFAEAEFQLYRTNLTLSVGGRYDGFSAFASAISPRASLIARPFDGTTLKLLYGQAYRVPNVYELNFAGIGTSISPNLEPESIHSYEAVWEQRLGKHFRASVSGYLNDVENVISRVRDFGADPNDPYDDMVSVINRDIHSQGVEFELEGFHASGLRGRFSYAWQESRDAGRDQGLGNSPRHLAKFNLDVPLYRDKVFAGLEVRYQSGVSTVYGTEVKPFWLVNATLFSARLAKGLEVSASIYNLLDERYNFPGSPEHTEDRIPQPGRTFRIKATYKF